MYVGEGLRVVSGLRVFSAVPDIAAANCVCEVCEICRPDRQVQGINLRAAVGIFVTVGEVSACGVSAVVPDVAAALGDGECLVRRVIDGQVQCHNGVAAVYVGEGLRVVA